MRRAWPNAGQPVATNITKAQRNSHKRDFIVQSWTMLRVSPPRRQPSDTDMAAAHKFADAIPGATQLTYPEVGHQRSKGAPTHAPVVRFAGLTSDNRIVNM